jgi:hypothetical protein
MGRKRPQAATFTVAAPHGMRTVEGAMPFTPASTGSVLAFVAILIVVVALFIFGVGHAFRGAANRRQILRHTILSLVVWLGLLSALSGSGQLARLPFGGLPVFLALIFVVVIVAATSRFAGQLAAALPLAALVAFQAFRLPLELVLHAWAAQGTIPGAMTWTGQNWDIVTGIVALAAAPFANRFRALAWFANVVGALLLANVMRVVLMTSPLPFAWDVQPRLLLAFHLPYMLIAPVCVGGALFGHIVLTRALLARPAK